MRIPQKAERSVIVPASVETKVTMMSGPGPKRWVNPPPGEGSDAARIPPVAEFAPPEMAAGR
mgnify:CR=1 FL=1